MMAEQPDEARCAFFLQKKRRYCRFRPNGNAKYCPEHAGALGIDQGRERILCPLNPKHSCYKDSLEKHLKKCRKQEKASPPYLSKGINLDADVDNNEREIKTPLKDCSTVELQNLIEKVHRLYDEHVKHIDEEILHHPCMDEELYNESYGIPAIRHRKQQASLIGQLQKLGLLREGLCFVELGAGKGNLSHWIQQALPDKSDLGFVLVDYGHVRYKADNKHKWPDTGPKFERLRIDIADLNLGKVESISANQRPVVAVGKHLCGGATDFALRCVTKTLEVHKSEENASQPEQKKFKLENDSHPRSCLAGVTVALCCHHRCTWQTYVGKEFIKNCGLSPGEFTLLCKLSGWTAATWTGWKTKEEMNREISEGKSSTPGGQTGNINQGTSSTPEGQETGKINEGISSTPGGQETGKINEGISSTPGGQETSNTVRNVDSSPSSEPKNKTDPADKPVISMEEHRDQDQPFSKNDLQLSPSEREEIGRKCKRLIDIGRVHYLRKCGLQSQLKTYIDEKLTPENVVIVAKSNS